MRSLRVLTAAMAILAARGFARGEYSVQVELTNTTGADQVNWPVALKVYTVLGRNLPAGSVRPDGFAVIGPTDVGLIGPGGVEVPHRVEKVPPYDQPGNDELLFVIRRIAAGQTLRYRILNAAIKGKTGPVDMVHSPHNLLKMGGFEPGAKGQVAGVTGDGKSDRKVKRSGAASLMLTADGGRATARIAKPVKLIKGVPYYFGCWSKTDHVARFGYQAGPGAHVAFGATDPATGKAVAAFAGRVMAQCSTRDWLKMTFEAGVDDWGMDRYHAVANVDQATVEFVLPQPRHYYMLGGKTRGTWWLDEAVLMPQPVVHVRFDLVLKPRMTDGLFVFSRPPNMPLGRIDERKRGQREWAAMPYAHEKLTRLDAFAVKGQRVSYCIGIYHNRPVKSLGCEVKGEAIACNGAKLPVELIEYCPGYLGPDRRRYMDVLNGPDGVKPATPAGDAGVRYFFITFHVPADARAGKYTGDVQLSADGKAVRTVPLALRVQDMVQAAPKDVFVGLIYQGGNPRFDDEGMTVYARSGFNCVMRFGGFLDYDKDADGKWQVNLDKLDRRMKWLKGFGMRAVGVFSDFDLGPKWNGGTLLKRVRGPEFNTPTDWADKVATAEKPWKAQIRRIEDARAAHPEWPELIYMTFDEPNLHGGRNGKPLPAMAWVNQLNPKVVTTLDVQFDPLRVVTKWYTTPAFDDPATWAGPEVYNWIKRQGKTFGYCGAADKDEGPRFQGGLLMASTGAKYFHAWHLTGGHVAGQVAYDGKTKKLLRAPAMINWAGGMNDLRAWALLTDAVQSGGDPRATAAAKAWMKDFFTLFNGDHRYTWTLQPWCGAASQWGYEQFYDDWQEQMLQHAAAIKGVRWVE